MGGEGKVVEMKTGGKRVVGRPKMRGNYTVREDLMSRKIKGEWDQDRKTWKRLCETHNREKVGKMRKEFETHIQQTHCIYS